MALSNLIFSGQIPKENLIRDFGNYKNKEKIKQIEDKIYQLLSTKEKNTKELEKLMNNLAKEYEKFVQFLIQKYKPLIEEEKKKFSNMKVNIENKVNVESLSDVDKGKMEKAFKTTSLVSIIANSLNQALKIIFPTILFSPMGKIISGVVPALGAFTLGGNIYQTAKIIKEPKISKADKLSSIAILLFSGMGLASLAIPAISPLALISLAGVMGSNFHA